MTPWITLLGRLVWVHMLPHLWHLPSATRQSLPHADSRSALASSSDTPSVAQVGVGATPVPVVTVPPTTPSFLPVYPVPVAVSALPAILAGLIHAPVPVPAASPPGGLVPPQVSAVVVPSVAPWIELLKINPIKDTSLSSTHLKCSNITFGCRSFPLVVPMILLQRTLQTLKPVGLGRVSFVWR